MPKLSNSIQAGLCITEKFHLKKYRSNPSEVLLGKGVLKISNKFTGEHSCRSVISIKLLCNFTEITGRGVLP